MKPHLKAPVGISVSMAIAIGLSGVQTPTASASSAHGAVGRAATPVAQQHRSPRVPGVGTVTWGPCTDPTLVEAGAQCATLSVPLDYARPAGAKVRLALSRVRHTVPDEQAQGIMLVNPGGPGGSGLGLAVLGEFIPDGAGRAFDWIGFDPRGVGSSQPRLSCEPDYFQGPRPDYEPTRVRNELAWLVRSITYAITCREHGGALLDHVKTTDNVRDMNAIRSALGEEKINYYGFSYGTYLGQVFATMFPSRVRRMVLDANIDPRKVWYQANLGQDFAFERVLRRFFDWVARHDDTYHLGTTRGAVERRYYDAQDRLRTRPRGSLGPAEWNDVFVPAGYTQFFWPDVADAFAAFVGRDDAGPATSLYEGFVGPGDDNSYAMYLGTECTDAPWPRNWLRWHRDNSRVADQAPFLTWDNAWFNAPCAFWTAPAAQPVDVRGRNLPPMLLTSETLDAATPFSGSLEVRRRFGSASLIATEGGVNHANTLAGNACVDDRIAAYLQDGTTPARRSGSGADVTCAPLPEPDPVPASARSLRSVPDHLPAKLREALVLAGRMSP